MQKLNLLILATVLLFALPLHAQWNIGGVFGINIASISAGSDHDIPWLRGGLETREEYSSRVAYGLGVVLDRPLSSQIDLHLEPMYLQKGATIKGFQTEVLSRFAGETRYFIFCTRDDL